MLVAVTEVVPEVIASVFEGIEGLVLDFPAWAGTSHKVIRMSLSIGISVTRAKWVKLPSGACSQYSRKFTLSTKVRRKTTEYDW